MQGSWKLQAHADRSRTARDLNEFTLENVTAALSAPFTGVKALAELRALSYFAWEGYPKHYDLGEEITRH
jgi:hypothetical protein